MLSRQSGDAGQNVSSGDSGKAPDSQESTVRGVVPPGQRRKPARTVVGTVWSDKMQKTRAVRVIRLVKHPKYGKYVRRKTTYFVHDENEESKAGDRVLIAQTRPLSKLKRWRLVKVLERAKAAAEPVLSGEELLLGPEVGKEVTST